MLSRSVGAAGDAGLVAGLLVPRTASGAGDLEITSAAILCLRRDESVIAFGPGTGRLIAAAGRYPSMIGRARPDEGLHTRALGGS